MPIEESLIRIEASSQSLVWPYRQFLDELGLYQNLYFKIMENELVILLLYVDDLFLTGKEKLIVECKRRLATEFEMKDLGLLHYFLGLEVWQSLERIFLN